MRAATPGCGSGRLAFYNGAAATMADEADSFPLLESLLKIDDRDRRTKELLRLLVFHRAQMQAEIMQAGLLDEDELSHDKTRRERYAYAQQIHGYYYMDRSDVQMFWDAARKKRAELVE